jgi:DNA-binding LytR/AlgR family response regulator
MNGFELLDRLDKISFDVVFVTAYDHFALKTFRYYAVDYLLKPVDQSSLRKALYRILEIQRGFSKELLESIAFALNNCDTGKCVSSKCAHARFHYSVCATLCPTL